MTYKQLEIKIANLLKKRFNYEDIEDLLSITEDFISQIITSKNCHLFSSDMPDSTLIKDLNVPTRIKNDLISNGINTIGDLPATSHGMMRLTNIGRIAIYKLEKAISEPDK